MASTINPDSFGFLVTDVARLLRAEMDRRIAAAGLGLTAGEGRTLLHAARAGAVRQSALAERMGLEPMTVSSYLDRLEGKGLVVRRPDPDDRRANRIELTAAAADAVARIAAIGTAVRNDAAQGVTPEAWAAAQEVLRSARDRLAALRAAPGGETPA